MENLLQKLQEEVGLSEEQATKTLTIVKEFMDEEGLAIDWDKFFKTKYEDLKGQAKSLFDMLSEKAEGLTVEAKRAARDLAQKASDYLDDNKK